MGVQGLWELLAPVGRRVSVETLAGKKLAIDASIWMVQFMKAMRDDNGDMVRNAHLLGFFRRICKLLFLRTKPVFVFDGATPALKRRTIASRRRNRDQAKAKIRKTAEKLLLNHLKAKRLEELAEEVKRQRQMDDNAKGKKPVNGKGKQVVEDTGPTPNQESLDELLARSLAAEEETMVGDRRASAGVAEEEDEDEDEEMIIPVTGDKIDPTVLASLPPSMQLDLLVQMRERLMAENRQKYQKIKKVPTKFSELQIQSYLKTVAFRREIDQVQKCAAGRGIGGVQSSRIASEANREFIFSSSFTGDKQMLTSPGVQVNGKTGVQVNGKTGVQANEKTDHTLKKKSVTTDFVKTISSTSQSKSTTDASDGKFTADFGDDVETYCDERGRVRVSRVRALGMRMTRDLQRNLDFMKEYEQEKRRPDSCTNREPSCTKDVCKVSKCHSEVFHAERASSAGNAEDIEAISRNIDLLEKHVGKNHLDKPSILGSEAAIEISFSEDDGLESTDDYFLHLASGSSALKLLSKSVDSDGNKNESDSEFAWEEGSVHNKETWKDDHQGSFASLVGKGSFEEDEIDWEDGTLCLNSEEGTLQLPKCTSHSQTEPENVVSKRQFEEEADIQEAIRISLQEGSIQAKESWNDDRQQNCASLAGKSSLEEDEVDWEDGTLCLNSEEGTLQNITSHSQAEHENVASNRQLEEEANIQEAIRRSLDDFKTPRSLTISDANIRANLGMSTEDENSVGPLDNFKVDNSKLDVHVPLKVSPERTSSHSSSKDGLGHIDFACGKDVRQNRSPEMHLPSATSSAFYGKSSSTDELNKNLLVSSVIDNGTVDMLNVNNVLGMHPHEGQFTQIDQCINASKQAEDESHAKISTTNFPESTVDISLKTTSNMADTVLPDYKEFDASKSNHSGGRHENADSQKISLAGKSVINQEPEQFMEKDNGVHTIEPDNLGETTTQEYLHDHKEVSQANLDEEISLLRQERINLGDEQRRLERNAESVSSEMFAECQELLQMFGLPYIIAPTEAEAQCAHMELLKLVDGVVTDDSDVFLFGARSVYKNIFDDRKYVETYLMKDIESELGLNRDKLIHMAMLLGSDYTEGVSGIGIVNAIEVMRAFPEEDGLQKFREWVESPDPSILGKLDPQNGSKLNRTPTKASKHEADQMQNSLGGLSSEDTSRGNGDQPSVDATSDIKNIFMSKHRTVSKNWHLPATFPSDLVISAYISPQVDKSTDSFSWGRPDLVLLRKLCWERFGWNNQKADELLVPVLKEHSKHETQLRLEAFYTFNERFAKIRSKRIKKAVKGITGTSASELMDDHVHDESNSQIKKRSRPSAEKQGKPQKNSDEKTTTGKKAPKLLKRKNAGNKDVHPPDGAGDSVNPDQDGQNTESGTRASIRGRGRGRGRGRAMERGRGRGRGRGIGLGEEHQSTEGSSSKESNGASEMQERAKEPEAMSGSRRSTRQRKQVKYSEESVEANDLSTLSNQKEVGGLREAAVEQERLEKDDRATDVDASGLEDCYFSGGGFCVDDESDLNVGATQATAASTSREFVEKSSEAIEDVSVLGDDEDHSSRAYLYGGGGFCVVESDEQGDEAEPTTSSVKDTVEISSEGASDSGSKRGRDIVEDSSIDEKERKSGLTAMPWLRRKRRKV